MLDTLKIKNLALIKELEVEFSKGLNIITGETGAGKSIIVNSLQLILGKRGSTDIIRENEDKCEVEAIFDLENFDDYLVIKRILTKNQKNKIKINDEFATLSSLKNLTQTLIDFSAQNQFLFDLKNQMKIYDSFCNLTDILKEYSKLYSEYISLKKEIKEKEQNINKIAEQLVILNHQLKELTEIPLEEIDEENLKKEIQYFENIELIKECINLTLEKLDASDDFSVKNQLHLVKSKLYEISNLKKSFEEAIKILENIEVEIGEITNLCLKELGELPEDNSQFNSLIELEEKLNSLKRKYRKNSVNELISLKKEIQENIHKLENFEDSLENEKAKLNEIEKRLYNLAEIIHSKRVNFKEKFEKEISEVLKLLKMENIKFVVDIEKLSELTETGMDRINFLISTNIGEKPKPVSEIASGGEKSRIMLALKSFLSDYLKIPVLVFDEIDAGTGGETAFAIGKLLKKLSKNHQVFAITHFPQVAAFADSHFKVYKVTENNRTYTKIKKLTQSERIEELSRMIAGNVSEKARISAEELLNEAQKSHS